MAVSIANAPKFCHGGATLARALEKHVPAGVAATLNVRYDESDGDALFDAFYPARIGSKNAANYSVGARRRICFRQQRLHCQLSKNFGRQNFTVIGVNYSLAPGKTYPTPIRQVNTP